eukprot:IDg11126t1
MDQELFTSVFMIISEDSKLTLLVMDLGRRFEMSAVREDIAKLVVARARWMRAESEERRSPALRKKMNEALHFIRLKYGVPFGLAIECTNWASKELTASKIALRKQPCSFVRFATGGAAIVHKLTGLVRFDPNDSVRIRTGKRLVRWVSQCVLHALLTNYSMGESHIFPALFV